METTDGVAINDVMNCNINWHLNNKDCELSFITNHQLLGSSRKTSCVFIFESEDFSEFYKFLTGIYYSTISGSVGTKEFYFSWTNFKVNRAIDDYGTLTIGIRGDKAKVRQELVINDNGLDRLRIYVQQKLNENILK